MFRPVIVAFFALSALTCSQAALAHEGNPNYRSEVTGQVPGVEARVLAFDDRLEIDVEPGREATVLGYEDEPYVRVLDDGTVEVNRRSPTSYLNEDRFADVDVPDEADADAAPEWESVAAQGRYGWHDHRIHYMAKDLPPQVEDESVETKVFDWVVPIEVDGEPHEIAGTLTWVPDEGGPSMAVAIGLGAAVLASIALAVWRIRRRNAGADHPAEDGEAW